MALPFLPAAAGAADAVDIVLGVDRHVEVDDVGHVGDVEAARGDVGRDQHLDVPLLNVVQGALRARL